MRHEKSAKCISLRRVLLTGILTCALFIGIFVGAFPVNSSNTAYAKSKSKKEAVIVPPYWEKTRTGYIFTGDSRIRRLNLTIRMADLTDTWVVCKSGKGYDWFASEGLSQIERIMEKEDYIDDWIIISGWGVNDLWNVNTYTNKYSSLLKTKWKKCKLYLMSVNPVNGNKTAKYSDIPYFNSGLKRFVQSRDSKTNKNIYYIDTYSAMKRNGFSTIDGLHYTESTNRFIYKTISGVLADNYKVTYKNCPAAIPREYMDDMMSGSLFGRIVRYNEERS